MTFKKILETTAAFYDVGIKDICGARRTKELVRARQIVCYLARKELNKSSPYIGRELGGRDHTTVLYAVRKIALDIHENIKLSHEIDSILKLIKGGGEYVEEYFSKKKTEQKEIKRKRKRIVVDLKRISKNNLSSEQLQRHEEILSKYKEGLTFAEIAKEHNLTRERIRQITEKALLFKAKELSDQGIEIDPEKFLRQERNKHLLKMKEKHEIPKKRLIVKKEKRWSRYYDYCRKCATKGIKHHSYGYCKRCWPTSEIFKKKQKEYYQRNKNHWKERGKEYYKNYYKRPDVIAKLKKESDLKNFGGNREKAIELSGNRCSVCGISRQDSQIEYRKDFFVIHLNSKDNNLENLRVLCFKCFHQEPWQNKTISLFSSEYKTKIPAESILNIVADYYGVKPDDITGSGRKREFVIPRMVAVFLIRRKSRAFFPEIGRILGGKDHTTIIHAYKKISVDYDTNEKIKKDIEKLEELIKK